MVSIRFRPRDDIAIVGMATRVPGADDYDAFWEGLVSAQSHVAPLSDDSFGSDIHHVSDPTTYAGIRSGLYNAGLAGVDQFDSAFFHITPRKARVMDPQQRILLEESWHCIEDSGVGLEELQRRRTSVFVGTTGNDYALLACQQGADSDPYAPLGNFSCMLANRISHAFGFSAESLSIDTACSSSLVALDLACKELRARTSDYSLAGGVCLTNHPWRFVSFTRAHMMSPEGVCRPFDAEANGFVQGEGVGVLLLERLGDALERGHRILGVIRGSAVNHGGAVANITAPNPAAQREVIMEALRRAKLPAAAVSYVEAHGTGTSLGDPIEVESLTRAFRHLDPDLGNGRCGLGSVKANIGHLSSAAGVIGIIKVLLMMRHRELVATLNHTRDNPLIGFANTPFFPVWERTAWHPTGGQNLLVAGVSGFGFGGVNAHIVVTSPPTSVVSGPPVDTPLPFLLSAHTQKSMTDLVGAWTDFAESPATETLTHTGVARTLISGRKMLAERRASFLCPDGTLRDAVADLRRAERPLTGGVHLRLGAVAGKDTTGTAVLGVTSMLLRGLGTVASVRTGIDHALVALALAESITHADLARAGKEGADVDEITVGAPRFPLCAPDGQRWLSPTLVPADYLPALVAACRSEHAALELPLETIAQLYLHQSTYRLLLQDWMRSVDELGAQAAPEAGVTEEHFIAWFAADDERALLLRFMHVAADSKIRGKWQLRAHTDNPAVAELAALVRAGHLSARDAMGLLIADPDTKISDEVHAGLDGLTTTALDASMLPLLAERQVGLGSLSEAIDALTGLDDEASPRRGIEVLSDESDVVERVDSLADVPATLLELWLAGRDVAWADLYDLDAEPAALPGTRFDRRSYWVDPPRLGPVTESPATAAHPILGATPSIRQTAAGERVLSVTIPSDAFYVRDHVVGGVPILPGVAYIELALAAASLIGEQRATIVQDMTWLRPMRFDRGVVEMRVEVALQQLEDGYRFTISSFDDGIPVEHARGLVGIDPDRARRHARTVEIEALRSRAKFSFDKHRVYGEVFADAIGFDYGPAFRVTRTAYGLGTEALEELDSAPIISATSDAFVAHPSILDASLRTVNWLGGEDDCTSLVMHVPFSVDAVVLLGDLNEARFAVATPSARVSDAVGVRTHDLDILSASGQVLAHVDGFTLRPLALDPVQPRIYARELAPVTGITTGDIGLADVVAVISDAGIDATFRELATSLAALRCSPGSTPSIVSGTSWLTEFTDLPAGTRLDIVQCVAERADDLTVTLDDLHLVDSLHTIFRTAAEHGWVVRHTVLSGDRSGASSLTDALEVFTRSIRFVYPDYELGVLRLDATAEWWNSGQCDSSAFLSDAYLEAAAPWRTVSATGIRSYAFREVATSGRTTPCVGNGKRYLVTGGAGALALELVRHYRAQVDASFLLLGRRAFDDLPEEQQTAIRGLGSSVSYHQCDVVEADALSRFVESLRNDDAPVAGVFHLAGGIAEHDVTTVGQDDLEHTLGAKLVGASNLDLATLDLPLECFVLFSSLSALVGDSGGSGYAMANAGLASFATRRQELVDQGRRRGTSSAVMWPVWEAGALRPTGDQAVVLSRHFGLQELRSDEAFDALDIAVATGVTQSVVLKGDERRYARIMGTDHSQARATDEPAAEVGKSRPPLLDWLAEIIAGESGISSATIGAQVPLAEYGIDSIMIINLLARMGSRFSDLPSTLFFEAQSMSEVADYLTEHYPDAVASFGRSADHEPRVTPETTPVSQAGASVEDCGDIAIIGFSGRYPQSEDLDEFWEHLLAGDDCIEVVPRERWDHDQYFSADRSAPGTVNTKWGGFLRDISAFDSAFFGISRGEGKVMDPQERLFLETVYHAFEHAGYPRNTVAGSNAAVYVGVMNGHYQLLGAEELTAGNVVDARTSYAAIANRVSHFFDLHGPSMAVDTMCSSSLTAIHLACEQLRSGGSSLAVAGGVNVIAHPAKYVFLSEQHFGSTEGKCRAFGEGGDGYVPAEGVGAVILKPLHEAIADNDVVHAVIRATTLNHGGRTNGFTVPNPKAQAELVAAALDRAGVHGAELGYVEAHGTGTVLGDPVEVTGLTRAFVQHGLDLGDRRVPIGSVKANIGHAESSAGIASLTKVLLQMKHRTVVPSIHADPVNPRLDLDRSPLRLVRSPEAWDVPAHPVALISSFGAGGSNAHMVLAAHLADTEGSAPLTPGAPSQLVVVSAHSREALDDQIRSLATWVGRRLGESGADGRPLRGAEEALETVKRIVSGVIEVPADEISDQARLVDLGLGPQDFVRLCAELEQTFARRCAMSGMDTTTVAEIASQVTTDRPQPALPHPEDAGLLRRVAHTLQQCREAFESRVAFEVRSMQELHDALLAYQAHQPYPGTVEGSLARYREPLRIDDAAILAALDGDDWEFVARSWVAGHDSDWTVLNDGATRRFADVPGYAFRRTQLWLERRTSTGIRATDEPAPAHPDTRLTFENPGDRLHFEHVFRATDPLVTDHVVSGRPMVPGAAQLALVRRCLGLMRTNLQTLADVRFLSPIIVESDVTVVLSFAREQDRATVRLESPDGTGRHLVHSQLVLIGAEPGDSSPASAGDRDALSEARTLSHEELYRAFDEEHIRYGTSFRSLAQVVRGPDSAVATLRAIDIADTPLKEVSTLDAALQMPAVFVGPLAGSQETHVPASIERVRFGSQTPAHTAYLRRRDELSFDVALRGPDGSLVADIRGLRVANLPPGAGLRRPDSRSSAPAASMASGVSIEIADSVLARLLAIVAEVLQTPVEQIDPTWTFTDLGVDSISGVRMVDRINEHYDTEIRSTVLFDHATAEHLRDHLLTLPEVVQITGDASDDAPRHAAEPTSSTDHSAALEPIAIVGMSGRFPGAGSTDEFWELLRSGSSAVSEVAPERWDASAFYSPDAEDQSRSNSKWGGFIDRVDHFDPELFRVTGYEARWMDPQQRLMLTESWHALDDAGYAAENPHRSRTGVFVGCCPGDYQDLILGAGVALQPQAFWGTSPAVVSARVAYTLDLSGPCASFDTACSSALTATYYACQSLWAGRCDMAVAGGVFLLLSPKFHLMAGNAGMLSPSGRCAAFAADADGFVPSEAVGAVVLKRVSQARADGDQILALIRGIEIGQDGKTNGLTAPNPRAQAELIRSVHERCDVPAESISYVETHGTGTQLGDAIEVEGLRDAFAGSAATGTCALGSVKTNIGHASAASGIAGLIKLVHAMRHRTIPASLYFGEENPRIEFAGSRFEVVDAPRPWESTGALRAGLSSFGFSGTNVHAVIEEAPREVRSTSEATAAPYAFPVSARTPALLPAALTSLAEHLERHGDCSPLDLSYTLTRRRHVGWVGVTFHAATVDELVAAIRDLLAAPEGVRGEQILADVPATADPRLSRARMMHLPPARLDEQRFWFQAGRGLPEGFARVKETETAPAAVHPDDDDLVVALAGLRDGTVSLADMAGVLEGMTHGR